MPSTELCGNPGVYTLKLKTGHLEQLFDVSYVKKIWLNKEICHLFYHLELCENDRWARLYQMLLLVWKGLASKTQKMLWVSGYSWFMQVSFGLNPAWLLLKRLLCSIKVKGSSKMSFSSISKHSGSNDTGW